MDTIEVPRGRTSSILLLALLTFGTFVLMIVPFLSQNSKYHISFIIVYVWETILFAAALVAMVLLIILRKSNEHLMVTQRTLNRKQRVTRYLLFVIFGASASILPFYECKQAATCLDVANKGLHALQFTSYMFISIYTACHGIFAALCDQYRCKSFATRLLVVVILSANATLFGNSVFNTMRSLHTQPKQFIHHSLNTSLYGEELANNSTNSTNYYFAHTLVYSVCENGTEIIDRSGVTLHVHEYTFPLMIEFLLLSLIVLVPLWNIATRRQTDPTSINTDTNTDVLTTSNEPTEHAQEQPETQSITSSTSFEVYTPRARMVKSLKSAGRFVSQYSIIFSSVFAMTVFVLHVVVHIGNELHDTTGAGYSDRNLTSYDTEYYYLQTVYTYIVSLVPFIGYFVARQQRNSNVWRFDVETALLIFAGCAHIMLCIFETVDSITVLINHPTSHVTEDVMYFIKILFHYVGIYFQIKFILKAFCLHLNSEGFPDQKVHVRGIIIFLGICNAERWLADSFLPPTVLKFANDIQGDDTFGHVNWWIIVQTLFPGVIFYRIWSAITCFKVYDILTQRQ